MSFLMFLLLCNTIILGQFQINSYSHDGQEKPQTILLNNGNIFVCWESDKQVGNDGNIFACIVDRSGNKILNDFTVSANVELRDIDPHCCLLTNGNILITWIRDTLGASSGKTMVKIIDEQANIVADEFSINESNNMIDYAESPTAFSLENGGFLISHRYSSMDSIRVVLFDNNHLFVNSYKFKSYSNSYNSKPRLIEIEQNNVCITFEDYDQHELGVFFRFINLNQNSISEAIQVNEFYWDDQTYPDIIKLNNNSFAISWVGDVTDSIFAYCKIFDKSGNAISDEIVIKSDIYIFHRSDVRLLLSTSGDSFYLLWRNDNTRLAEKILAKEIKFNGAMEDLFYTFYSLETTDGWIDDFNVILTNSSEYFIIYENLDDDWVGIFGAFVSTTLTDVNKNTYFSPSFKLEQNYPNPFNPSTTINYSISKKDFVSLVIFNSLGQKISTLVNEIKNIGEYSSILKANNLPTGIYIMRLQAGNNHTSRKMLLLK